MLNFTYAIIYKSQTVCKCMIFCYIKSERIEIFCFTLQKNYSFTS